MFQRPGQSQQHQQLMFESFVAVQTGSYQVQPIRPFKATVNDNVTEQLIQATQGGRNLGVAAVQELSCDVIAPQANVEGVTRIAGDGWTSRRFRIMAVVVEQNPYMPGAANRRILYGYSDHCDASTNDLPPEMRIYWNSETILGETIRNTVHGPQRQIAIFGANQILSPIEAADNYSNSMFARSSAYLIRPEDNFNLVQTNLVAQNFNNSGLYDEKVDISFDHRSMVGDGGTFKYSNRRDTSPTRYLSNSLNAYQHAFKEAKESNFGTAFAPEMMLGEASNVVRNSDIRSNTFLARLNEQAGYMSKGYVTWGELVNIFPELRYDNRAQFAMDNGRSISKCFSHNDSRSWDGADYTSVAAAMIAQAVPSIMMDTHFRKISFAVTNGSGKNNYIFVPHGELCQSIVPGMDMQDFILDFERRLNIDVLNNITRGNELPIQLSVSTDIVGDTIIDISIAGSSQDRFIAPTFADSLYTPVITRNAQLANEIANDITYLVQGVIGQNPNQPTLVNNLVESQYRGGYTEYKHPVSNPGFINSNNGASHAADFGLL